MTDKEKLGWLSGMIVEQFAKIEYTLAKGCLCGSCYEYKISWTDIQDEPVSVSADTFEQAIEAGHKLIPDPWGF